MFSARLSAVCSATWSTWRSSRPRAAMRSASSSTAAGSASASTTALARIPGGLALGVGDLPHPPQSRRAGRLRLRPLFRLASRDAVRTSCTVTAPRAASTPDFRRLSGTPERRSAPIRRTAAASIIAPARGRIALYMGVERMLARLDRRVPVRKRLYRRAGSTNSSAPRAALRRIVANGLSEAEFVPVDPDADAADLLYVGELRAAKGIDTLFEALPLVGARSRRAAARGAGRLGPGPAILTRARASGLGVAAHVTFPGPMPIRQAFTLGRVMVVPSRAESMPYVVLEAAGARVPMVATNVGGIPEIFGPFADRLGPCDDPDDLRAASSRCST